VAGRKSRSWKDEEAAAKALKEKGVEPYETSILSPAKAEKALGKEKKQIWISTFSTFGFKGKTYDPAHAIKMAEIFENLR
jgi:hypothetical protein